METINYWELTETELMAIYFIFFLFFISLWYIAYSLGLKMIKGVIDLFR